MRESYAAENSKATIGFYEVDKKDQHTAGNLPKTGDDQRNKELLISGISILLFITGMIAYRILNNEERI
nr:LPXTG cell wall anchor domain-containing protein [Enterococcus sp. DIV0869a]